MHRSHAGDMVENRDLQKAAILVLQNKKNIIDGRAIPWFVKNDFLTTRIRKKRRERVSEWMSVSEGEREGGREELDRGVGCRWYIYFDSGN